MIKLLLIIIIIIILLTFNNTFIFLSFLVFIVTWMINSTLSHEATLSVLVMIKHNFLFFIYVDDQ